MNISTLKRELKGKFFSATFVKQNGEVRTITGRLGVKPTNGGTLKYDAESANNLIVWELKNKAYRTIKLDRLITLRYNGKEITGKEALMFALS